MKMPDRSARRLLKILGPGIISGASNDDPSAIGTYVTAGASFGLATLWTALFTFPLIAVVTFMCAKVGMVSGTGLAGVLRKHYPRRLLYALVFPLVIANTINAGADIGAIAAAMNLLVPVPITLLVIPIGLLVLLLQVWGSYRLITNIFKWLTLFLFAYVLAALFARPNAGEVLAATFIPRLQFDNRFLLTLVAIMGTRISPYLFFWQASQAVEMELSIGRRRRSQRKGATHEELSDASLDVNIGMFFSNLVMYFIILTTAATLFQAGKTDIQSATEAAEALRPLAGDAARLLFAFGLIGAGLLAVPVLTGSAAYALAETFGWRFSMDEKPHRARPFYVAISAMTLIGVAINYLGINPISLLVWAGVLNGLLAPVLLAVLMHIANNRQIVMERVNNRAANVVGWLTVVLLSVAAAALIFSWLRPF